VTATVAPSRRRLGGFWLGAIFALGAVVGVRYLMGWAEREGVVDRLGLGPDGSERGGVAAQGPVVGPPAPPPPAPPPPAPSAVARPPVETTPAPPVPPALPPPPARPAAPVAAAGVVAALPDAAVAAAGKDAAPHETPVAAAEDEEPDEEALLRAAVPNAEQAVIGAEGAEPPAAKTPEGGKREAVDEDGKAARGAAPTPSTSAAAKPKKTAPASPTPPPRETAILHITTRPVGAIVRTKGQVLGRTPINLHFRTGNIYELTFVKSGYEPGKRLVAVPNTKDKKVALQLKKRRAPRKHSFFHPHR
jgi:hypothetical protein